MKVQLTHVQAHVQDMWESAKGDNATTLKDFV